MPKRIEIDDEVLAKVESQCPKYLSPTGFINLLIDKALTGVGRLPAYCVGAGTQEGFTVSSVQDLQTQQVRQPAACEGQELPPAPQGVGEGLEPKKNKTKKTAPRFVFSVPSDLDWCRDKLLEFWREYKSGKKTEAAGATLIKGIRSIADKYGQPVVHDQLELACACNWESITLSNYERFGLPSRKPGAPAQPEYKHPAYRSAAEVLEEQERIAQQNIEHLRMKNAEREAAGGVLDGLF
jgi:hypothetical protein